MKKLTNKQFEEIISKHGSLFSEGSRYAKKKWGINISRQAIQERARNNYPDLIEDSKQDIIDESVSTMKDLLKSKREDIKFKASSYFLDRLSADYNPKSIVDHTTNGKDIQVDLTKYTFEQLEQLSKSNTEGSKD
jgi:hypothetical protein